MRVHGAQSQFRVKEAVKSTLDVKGFRSGLELRLLGPAPWRKLASRPPNMTQFHDFKSEIAQGMGYVHVVQLFLALQEPSSLQNPKLYPHPRRERSSVYAWFTRSLSR